MDNPQVTLTYIAGLFEGEGSVALFPINARTKSGKKMPQIRSAIFFTNTDPALISIFIDFFKQNGWTYYVQTDIRPDGRKVCYSVSLNKQADRLSFLKLMTPYFYGIKKQLAQKVIPYLEHRISIAESWKNERGGDGRYKKGVGTSQTPRDIELYDEYQTVKDTSETTRGVPVKFR